MLVKLNFLYNVETKQLQVVLIITMYVINKPRHPTSVVEVNYFANAYDLMRLNINGPLKPPCNSDRRTCVCLEVDIKGRIKNGP